MMSITLSLMRSVNFDKNNYALLAFYQNALCLKGISATSTFSYYINETVVDEKCISNVTE